MAISLVVRLLAAMDIYKPQTQAKSFPFILVINRHVSGNR